MQPRYKCPTCYCNLQIKPNIKNPVIFNTLFICPPTLNCMNKLYENCIRKLPDFPPIILVKNFLVLLCLVASHILSMTNTYLSKMSYS